MMQSTQSWKTMIQSTKGSLSADPLSGSILKVLMDNGFKQKIEQGYASGHTYTVLRAPSSSDFTLIDTWTEKTTDASGKEITTMRKTYQFFKIVEPESHQISIRPEEITAPAEELADKEKNIPGVSAATPLPEPTPIPAEIKPKVIPTVSSIDLLRKKFQTNKPSPELPASVKNLSATAIPTPATLSPEVHKKQFIETVFGEYIHEWELAQKIPARPFIYPTEYSWGTDAAGNPIMHTLEDYPEHARKLREKIVNVTEMLATEGTDIEHLTVGQVLDDAFKKDLLY